MRNFEDYHLIASNGIYEESKLEWFIMILLMIVAIIGMTFMYIYMPLMFFIWLPIWIASFILGLTI